MIRPLLRLVALLGPVALITWQALTLPPLLPRQANGAFPVLLLWLFVPWLLLILMWPEFSTLLKKPDLLVPFGLYLTASAGLVQLQTLPAVAARLNPALNVPVLGLAVSLGLLVQMLVGLPFAVWTTRLILQDAEGKPVDLLGGLAEAGRWGSRAAGVYLVGGAGLLLLALPPLALALAVPALGLTLAAVVIFWWSLLTAPLLLHVLNTDRPLNEALVEGLRLGRRHLWRWAAFAGVQLALLGWITFLAVNYTVIKGPNQTTSVNKENWSVNGFWIGGYEDSSRWLSKHAEALATRPLPLLALVTSIPLFVLAVAVKMRIAAGLKRVDRYLAQRPVSAWPVAVTFLVTGLVAVGLLYREDLTKKLLTAQLVRQYHQRLDRGESEAELHRWLLSQGEKEKNVDLLSRDPDPRVRRSLVPLLASGATLARKQEPRFGAFSESWSGFNGQWTPILKRLLDDPEESVRRRALEAVTAAREAGTFRQPLLRVLESGTPAERLLVAESLLHWAGDVALKILPDRGQPRAVRLAVLRGLDRWGWNQAAANDLAQTLTKMLDDPDTELRHGAIRGFRYIYAGDAPYAWQQVLAGPRADDRTLAFQLWVQALVEDPIYGGDHYPALDRTEGLGVPLEKTAQRAAREAVLCEAAKRCTELLDRTPAVSEAQALFQRQRGGGPAVPAFARQLQRLRLILRVLVRVRQLNERQESREAEFTIWLPQDKPDGPPPKRKLGPYLLEQARPVLAWCRNHGNGYASRFLHANGPFGGPDPWKGLQGKPRTIGQVLKDIHMNTDEALRKYLQQFDKK